MQLVGMYNGFGTTLGPHSAVTDKPTDGIPSRKEEITLRRVGIVAAWGPELDAVNRNLPPVNPVTHGAWDFRWHHLDDNTEIISVVSGVGKVFCASATQLLIAKFAPCEMYMTGICGALQDELLGESLVVPERFYQHDVQSPATPGDPFDLNQGRSTWYEPDACLLQRFRAFTASSIRAHFGVVVSGDQRIRSGELRDALRQTFAAIAVDQELAAFAHVCTVNRVPFLGVKAVSDNANELTEQLQRRHKLKACDAASNALIGFLSSVKQQTDKG